MLQRSFLLYASMSFPKNVINAALSNAYESVQDIKESIERSAQEKIGQWDDARGEEIW